MFRDAHPRWFLWLLALALLTFLASLFPEVRARLFGRDEGPPGPEQRGAI